LDAKDLQLATMVPVADLGSFVAGLDGRMRLDNKLPSENNGVHWLLEAQQQGGLPQER
jgi:hypothetical protein